MSAAELHLAVNHLPVLGPPFAAALLAAAMRRRSAELAGAGFLALLGSGLAAIVAYRSGLGASDVVADLPDVSAAAIEQHLHAARLLLWACVGSAAVSLAALARTARRGGYSAAGAAIVLALALALTAGGAFTAHLGGEIRHGEIR